MDTSQALCSGFARLMNIIKVIIDSANVLSQFYSQPIQILTDYYHRHRSRLLHEILENISNRDDSNWFKVLLVVNYEDTMHSSSSNEANGSGNSVVIEN